MSMTNFCFCCVDQNETGGQAPAPAPLAHHLSMPNNLFSLFLDSKLDNLIYFHHFLYDLESIKQIMLSSIYWMQWHNWHPCKVGNGYVCMNCLQVRRTKISERIRKLQDLIPNMGKVRFWLVARRCTHASPFMCIVEAFTHHCYFSPISANKHSGHVGLGCWVH